MTGCANPVQHATASQRPEVCITKAKSSDIAARLASDFLDRGYTVLTQTETRVEGEHIVDNAFAAALFGSRYDGTPKARIAYTIVKIPACTRVVADMNIVTNPGSAYERLTPMNNSQDSLKVQKFLDSVKVSFDKR